MGRAGKGKIDEEELLSRVKKVQEKYDGSLWSEKKGGRFVEGDWVRTRIGDGNRKGLSKCSVPKRVIDVRSYSVILDDGKRWSTESVVKCNKGELQESGVGGDGSVVKIDGDVSMEKRLRRKLNYLKEYYTD
ncbi:hypothetical protein NDU88_003450 [Pleurodeles waltl]|uniref:Uncharacterized protein n=1 Tax=Pleurodeles waltl TaxID=8319 RepID=A0AAV7UYH3_PLEWA|nr:hypothetical protein NDU88_003450 [Pleurodeles waltl]